MGTPRPLGWAVCSGPGRSGSWVSWPPLVAARREEGWSHGEGAKVGGCWGKPKVELGGRAMFRGALCMGPPLERNSYLVDPASSHMLVSKIKPCMCKYKLFCTVKLRMAH